MPATDFLAPDEFADLLDAPEFKTLRPAQRAAVFDAGLKDSEEWLRQNDALDEPSWQQTAMALGNRYRPAEADIELDKQGPVGTAVNAFKNLGPDVVQGVIGGAAKMADAASEMVGLSDPNVPSWMDKTADFTEKIQQEGQIIRPLNPANPTAATIGSGAGQAVAMLGTAGASLPVLGERAMTAVPAAMGFAMGAGQGVDTAEDMGITSPAARLGMGTAFGAIEGATEMLGGIGGKFIPTPKGLAGMALAPFMEGGEEMLSQGLQDATTAGVGQFMSDPNRPGFTQNGYELPAFNAAMLERQKQAAIGGAAGGMVFAGLQALSPNDNVSPNQTPAQAGTPQAPGTTPATAEMAGAAGAVPSTLSRIAQESLVADLPEDTGALTAEEVEDLETANLPPTPTPTLPPSQTQEPMQGLGGGVRGGEGVSETLPTVANPDPAQTITGSNVQTGTEMPVPPPTADAGAGAGAPGVVNQSQSSYLDRVLDAAIQDESMGELTIPVPEKNQNRDDLDKAVAVIEARGLNAASDGKSILVRGFRELRRAAPPPSNPVSPSPSPQVPARNASRSDAGRSPSESSSPPGFTHTTLSRDLEAGFMTTAGADALLDLAHSAFRAGQTFVQWSKSMLQRFGESIRQWLAGAWDHAKRSSQTGAVNLNAANAPKQQTLTVSSEGSRPVGRRIAAAADQIASQSTPKNGRDMLGSGPSKTDEANPDQASLEVKRAYQEISEWKEMAGRHLAHHQQQLAEMTASAGWQERRRTALNGESTSRSMLDAISDLQTRGSVSAFQHLLGRYTLPDGVAEAAMIYARRVSRDVLENQQVRESLDQEQRQQQAQMDALNRRWMPKWFPPSKPSATAQWWQDTLDERDAEARKPALGFISRVWRSIAEHPEAFQFGKTTSKSASDIAAAVSVPGKLVTARESGGTIRFSGKEGHLDIYDADTWEPYIRSTEAGSKGKQSGGGSQLYQAALDWIHNNGKTIRDDPAGLTEINDVRRTSNFASSALRWGTTEHLKPHADQAVSWGRSAKLNTASLLTKEMDNAFKAVAPAKDWTYDFTRNEFLDSRGNTLTRTDFHREAVAGNPGRSGIGMATLQRAVLTRSALEAFQRVGAALPLSGAADGQLEQLPESLRAVLYADPFGVMLAADTIRNLAKQAKTLAEFTLKVVRHFGEWIKPYVAELWARVRQTGGAFEQYLQGVWDHAKRSSQTGAVNFTSKLGTDLQNAASKAKASGSATSIQQPASSNQPPASSNQQPASSLQPAYIAAMQGRSSAMVPIADVYAQALTLDPTLTVDRFMAEVQAGDNAGTVLLEPPESAATIAAAGPFVLRNASGIPSTSMMVQRGFTHLDVSGQASQRGAVQFDSGTVDETRSRFASPREEDRLYETRADEAVLAEAERYLDSVSVETAVDAFVNGTVPLSGDAMVRAASRLLLRLNTATTAGTEVQRMWAHVQSQRMGRAWTSRVMSQDPARMLRQRAVANTDLISIAPILAAQEVLIDRADAVMDKRFDGGGAGAVEKITNILNNVQGDITERVEAILNAVMGARLKPRVTIREAVAGLVNGKTQRDEMIDDVARALLQKAKSSQVKPEQKTALAALVASLKRTLGAAVRGTALKPDALSFGELLARTFVDQVAEAPMFEESWKAGREQVRLMLIELGMTESAALKRLNELMPATPTVAYAPGMVKQAVQRGFEAAGYGQTLATGADQSGQRAVDVRAEVLRNPQKAMAAVLRVWDAEAQAGGISPEAWAQGRQLAVRALNETLQQWQQQAAETTAKAAEATKNRLLAKDSPALAKLLKELTAKIAPGMTWTEIFTDMPSTQKARQKEIYRRLMLDERLRGLTQDERLALTNELDKAWMRERRKVFNKELEKAGVIGEKDKTDRVKVQKALPKLLRMINLGMFNSEMWRDAVAPQYGLRMLTSADTAQLRTLAEAAWKLPEGVLRNQKLRDMLNAMQKKTGASWIEVLNSYWTAAVLSGLRTQFDTWLAAVNGMGTNLMQIGGLIARGQGKAAIDAHAQWWRGLIEGVRESGQILFKGDTSYLKRFGADLMKALEGETSVTPVPLGENLWKNGNTFQKYGLAPVMMFTGRLMAAADHINNTATTQGAIAVARALNPELYEGKVGFTETERTNARAQALQEVTGGREPQTSEERTLLSARVRELLNGTVKKQDYAAASEIGDMAAFQNDPTGVFGIIHSAMKQGLGSIQRSLGNYAEDVTANRFARVASGIMAGSLHGITGTRFMRFGANFGAEMTRYIPGSYALGKAGFYGRNVSRMQQELLLGKNLVGLMLGSTLAAVFLNGDDDDEGWQIEGDWSTLTPQEAKQRMSAGLERLTMWKRENGQVKRVSYKQWPTMGLFSVVGGMLDEKRHKPAQWAAHGTAGHLLRGLATGYVQVKNVSAVRNLVELFGEPTFSADGVTGAIDKFVKTSANFTGGFVPTLVKDAEIWADSRNFKPEGVAEQFLRSVPFARKFINDGRPQLNLLGEEVKLQRAPWSRAYTSVESAEAHRVLGALMARGLSLPMPSDQVHVIKDNVKVPLDTLGREAVWKYEKAVGQGYKDWLHIEGADLLKMTVEDAHNTIKRRAESIKSRAKAAVVR